MSHHRSEEDKKRLKRLYDETKTSCGAGAYYDKNKDRYVRYSSGSRNFKKYLRKLSSRAARRCKHDIQNGDYKKTFDYWWTLY